MKYALLKHDQCQAPALEQTCQSFEQLLKLYKEACTNVKQKQASDKDLSI